MPAMSSIAPRRHRQVGIDALSRFRIALDAGCEDRAHADRIVGDLAASGSLEHPSPAGLRPLHLAAARKTFLLASLIAAGADRDPATPRGTTPLMEAARWGNAAGVAMLLHAGADRHAVDDGHAGALDAALSGPWRDAVVVLLVAGAVPRRDGKRPDSGTVRSWSDPAALRADGVRSPDGIAARLKAVAALMDDDHEDIATACAACMVVGPEDRIWAMRLIAAHADRPWTLRAMAACGAAAGAPGAAS